MASNWIVFLVLCSVLAQFGCEAFGQQRLVGGTRAQASIPYQISLQAKANSGILDRLLQMFLMHSQSEWTHFCGGSILSVKHVITAAHCLDGADQTKIAVLAGTSSRLQGGQRHSLASYVIHPEYRKLQTNDIAIINVARPFTISENLRPIEFKDTNFVGGGVRVKLSGWGYTTPLATLTLPVTLRTVDLKTISNEQCQRQGYNVSVSEICTSTGILRGACMGDSGGPLVNIERNILIGLVSYGSRICGAGRPEVYTRVSEFIPWILQQMDNGLDTATSSSPTATTPAAPAPPVNEAAPTAIASSPTVVPAPADPPVSPVAPVMPATASDSPSKPSSVTKPKPTPTEKDSEPSLAAELDRIKQSGNQWKPEGATIVIGYQTE